MPYLWNGSDVTEFLGQCLQGNRALGDPGSFRHRVDSLSELHFVQGIYFMLLLQVLGSISDFKIEVRLQRWLSG